MTDEQTDNVTSTEPTQPAQQPPNTISSIDQIPQSLRNQLEANHKRGLQAELTAARQQLEQMNALKAQTAEFVEMLGSKVEIPEGSDLGEVVTQIGGTLESLKSEKEKVEAANKKQSELLALAQKEAATNLQNYHDTLINNELLGQLSEKTVSPKAAELLSKELKAFAEVGEDRKVSFKMPVTDENGHTSEQPVSAKEAVTLLEANSDWQAFFKSTVNSGTGGEVVDGVRRDSNGQLDFASLAADPAKYFEILEKNPNLVSETLKRTG